MILERLYYYRGFEIGLQPQKVDDAPSTTMPASGKDFFRCLVRIRRADSMLHFDSFTLERSSGKPFTTEFEAALYGCFAAERRINVYNVYRAMNTEEPHFVDLMC